VECTLKEHCPASYDCISDKCVFSCSLESDCASFPSTPHCNLVTHKCVACTQNGQCAKGFVCYQDSCVKGCGNSLDCTAPQVCDTSSNPGACVDCVTGVDCTGGRKCASDHKCVECRNAADCSPPKQYCIDSSRTCVECRDNTDCDGGRTCDPVLNICRSPLMMCDATQCTSQDQCPTGTVCTNYDGNTTFKCRPTCDLFESCDIYNPYSTCSPSGQQVCSCFAPCAGAQDCLFYIGTWCDLVSGRCISCDKQSRCTGGGVCRYNRCLSCSTDGQCKAEYSDRPWCIVANGTCVHCRTDGDCKTPGLLHCSQAGNCAECTLDAHCTSPKTCQSNVCSDAPKMGPCEQCSKDSECEAGLYCRTASLDGGTYLKCRKSCYDDYDCLDSPYNQYCAETGYCGCSI
jgi:hypothetical protein